MARLTVRQAAPIRRMRGFVLHDLLAVISVATLLGAMLSVWTGAFAKRSETVRCLANGRQMMHAFALYTQDHQGLLPPNEEATIRGHSWFSAMSGTSAESTNPLLAGNPQVNLLAAYASGPEIWKCPADKSFNVIGGRRVRTVRSVAMSCAVGTVCRSWPAGHTGAPDLPTHGSWLDGNYSHRRGTKFRTFGRQSDFVQPAATIVFVEEHPPSLNDGSFGTPGYSPEFPNLSSPRWVDYPAIYHNGAGAVTFADGHAELRRWRALRYPAANLPSSTVTPQQRKDWEWLGMHVTQPLR